MVNQDLKGIPENEKKNVENLQNIPPFEFIFENSDRKENKNLYN